MSNWKIKGIIWTCVVLCLLWVLAVANILNILWENAP